MSPDVLFGNPVSTTLHICLLLYMQDEDDRENAFPLTVAIKAPYYPNRKWQGEATALFTIFMITHMKV